MLQNQFSRASKRKHANMTVTSHEWQEPVCSLIIPCEFCLDHVCVSPSTPKFGHVDRLWECHSLLSKWTFGSCNQLQEMWSLPAERYSTYCHERERERESERKTQTLRESARETVTNREINSEREKRKLRESESESEREREKHRHWERALETVTNREINSEREKRKLRGERERDRERQRERERERVSQREWR